MIGCIRMVKAKSIGTIRAAKMPKVLIGLMLDRLQARKAIVEEKEVTNIAAAAYLTV